MQRFQSLNYTSATKKSKPTTCDQIKVEPKKKVLEKNRKHFNSSLKLQGRTHVPITSMRVAYRIRKSQDNTIKPTILSRQKFSRKKDNFVKKKLKKCLLKLLFS